MAKSVSKKRKVIVDSFGEAHINASFNNIIISLTNKKGEVISWSSAGKMGFRGSKKNTPYAAQLAAEEAVKVAHKIAERGDAVLLSPACASFDLFENYEDRGRQFKQAVRNL